MTRFSYTGTNAKTGQTETGTLTAASAQDAELRLSESGLRSARVTVEKTGTGLNHKGTKTGKSDAAFASPTFASLWFNLLPAPKPADIATFFRQFASLLHAGFTPLSALADLSPRTANKRIARAASDIGMATGRGESLGTSFARHGDVFPAHVAGLITAGETGGFLEYACEEIALGAEGDAALRQGLWLPKLLFWQAAWSVFILQPLLNNVGAMATGAMDGSILPGLLAALRSFLTLWLPLGIGLHLLVEIGGLVWRQPGFAAVRDRVSLALPVMRKLAYTRAVAGFTRLLRRLLLAGISPETAYVAATNAVPNAVYREQLMRGVPVLRGGNGLDAALQATGLLEHDPLQLLVTGQRTGQWTEMLDRVTATYQ